MDRLLERERELAAVEALVAGGGGVLCIVGGAGVGKLAPRRSVPHGRSGKNVLTMHLQRAAWREVANIIEHNGQLPDTNAS
jgi:hypothetical protein